MLHHEVLDFVQLGTLDFTFLLSVFQKNYGREALHVPLLGCVVIFLYIDFDILGLRLVLTSNLFDFRAQHLALAAPGGKKVHKDGFVAGLFHELLVFLRSVSLGKSFVCHTKLNYNMK